MKFECTSFVGLLSHFAPHAAAPSTKIVLMTTDAATFAGLRVASFESRRADDIARMIATHATACRSSARQCAKCR